MSLFSCGECPNCHADMWRLAHVDKTGHGEFDCTACGAVVWALVPPGTLARLRGDA